MKFPKGMPIGDLVVTEERKLDVKLRCKCGNDVIRKKTSLVAYVTSSFGKMLQSPKCKVCARGSRRARGTNRESLAKAKAKEVELGS